MPLSTWASFFGGSLLTHSVRKIRSTAITCDAFATESLGRPVTVAGKSTLPGARPHFRLLVNGTQIAVAILLRFR